MTSLCASGDADQDAAAPALVVRRHRQDVEGPACVAFAKAGFDELMQRVFAHHRLRAGASGHAFGLDADDAPRSAFVGMRDTDQRIRLFAALSAHRRPALQTEPGAQAHLGTYGTLATHDFARDRFGEPFDAHWFGRAGQHVERRFFENFRKARHMNAGPVGRKIRDHRELAVIDRRPAINFQMNDAAHARRRRRGSTKAEPRAPRIGGRCRTEARVPAGERGRWPQARTSCGAISASGTALYGRASSWACTVSPSNTRRSMSIGRASSRRVPRARPTGKLDVARKAREGLRIELRAQRRGNVQVSRPLRAVRGLRFVKRRNS